MNERGRSDFIRQTSVSRETLEKLDVYEKLLLRWNKKINLISEGTVDNLWIRHFLDSAQLVGLSNPGLWVDLGSGGGFPGAIVAILLADERDVVMVESDNRKAAFLRAVLREVGVSGRIISNRIENLSPLNANTISARALAPLSELLIHAERHLAKGGRALFLKGGNAQGEVRDALEHWQFDCETYKSKTDTEAVVLSIGEISRV